MAELRRNGPYIWVTWLSKLLTGEQSCEWAAWFKAHYENRSWEKVPIPFDQTGWLLEHSARVVDVRGQWEADGYRVFTEGQNAFALRGQTATLGGKPDLIAARDGGGTIIDIKTGQPSPAHNVQVMLYMYAVPKALTEYRATAFNGVVAYPGHSVEIPATAVDGRFVEHMGRLVRRLAADSPARKVPSMGECRFCNVTAVDCRERMDGEGPGEGETADF